MIDTLLPLNDVAKDDIASAGGKGANLGELIKIGMSVPPGFVITTAAYRELAATDPSLRPGVDLGDGAAIRKAWEQVRLPDPLVDQIRDRYQALRQAQGAEGQAQGAAVRVAVRSSATAEDLAEAAFAGQQDTYLDVVGVDDLLDAVRRCWASLWTERAISYRAKNGIDADDLAIAVVVQAMVPAAVAGVLFTADPVTGARDETIIDASPGLGEAVVAGMVTPEHYRLDRSGTVLEHRAGRTETVVGDQDTAAASGELSPELLSRLHRIGRRVQDHYGRPMDLEWAVAATAKDEPGVWVLQARPLTGLPAEPVTYNRLQARMFSVAGDYLHIRPYPMDMSTWLPQGPAGWLSKMAASVGVRIDLVEALRESDGVVQRLVPPSPRLLPGVVFAPLSIITRALKYHPSRWRNDRRYIDYQRRLALLAIKDPADLDWDGLLAHTRRVLSAVKPITALRIDYLPRAGLAIGRLFLALKLLGRTDLFADLLSGAETKTKECNQRLTELADAARNGPPAIHFDRLAGTDPSTGSAEHLLAALRADPACEEFVADFDAFLIDFGARETETPLLMSSPTWSDAPQTVLDLISMQPTGVEQPENVAERAKVDLLARHRFRAIFDQERVEKMIKEAQDGIGLREDSHFEFMDPVPMLRRTVFEMGSRLTAAGVLETAEDVLHLRLEELLPIPDPARLDPADLDWITKLVSDRKAARAALEGQPLLSLPAAAATGDALISGVAASSGVVTGVVRVISSPRDFTKLQPGEIMVCPYTNPSWTPLFRLAAAVITDSGGVGSHAAIVAREYGIPAIMGTGNGTSVLADGMKITVDGDHGRALPA
jgi:pyruvate,water dikinase